MHFLSASWPFLPSFPLSWIGGLPRCPVLGCDVNAFLPMAFWETRKAQLRLPRAFLGARRCVLSHLHLFALARAGRGPVRKKCVLSLPSWGPSRPFSPLLWPFHFQALKFNAQTFPIILPEPPGLPKQHLQQINLKQWRPLEWFTFYIHKSKEANS